MSSYCSDNKFNKLKLMYKFNKLKWFIEKHALKDAKTDNDAEFSELLISMGKDLEKHISKLDEMVCGKCKNGK
jgi:hypothetical protein